jgi:hypothetical protein
MNYGELKTLIAGYLHRTDQTANVVSFITLAQARINRDVKDSSMIVRATITADGVDRYITMPTDARELIDVQAQVSGGRKSLLPRTPAQMNTIYATVTASGDPADYCVRGRELEIQPTPGATTVLELLYWGRLTAFSADGDTNTLLTNRPNLYVYAAMIEACVFLQGDERLPVFQSAYSREVDSINEETEDLLLSGGPLQITKLDGSTP